jgi:thioesterase domain-containing protein/acyl carrier protein
MLEHRNVTNYIQSAQTIYPIDSTFRALQGFSVSFDASVEEIWLPFSVGATIVVGTFELMRSGDRFAVQVNQLGISFLSCTPTLLSMVDEDIPSVKILIFGGEVCSTDLGHRWCKPGRLVYNTYGPTEASVIATYSIIDLNSAVTIGKALPGYEVLIVNENFELVGANEEGELLIGGEGITRGYLHMDDLTAQKFHVKDRFKGTPERYYCTGDLARYNSSGEIEYIGRKDSQVKIRGYRIEPGEIEAALKEYKNVKENVIMVREDILGDKRLTAYIIAANNRQMEISEIRKFLRTKVPEYMVPSAFVFIDKFPVTSGGKLDWKALPIPYDYIPDYSENYQESATETEKKLNKIWSELLQTKQISMDENFFEIGGHSILAVKLMIKIEKVMGIRLPLATLIDHSNIRDMAEFIDGKDKSARWGSLVPIRSKGTRPPLYLVHGAGLNLLLYTTITSHLHPDQPVLGLQAKGLDGVEEPLGTIEEMAKYYLEEIFKIDKSDSFALAGFSMGGHIAFEMARQLVSANKKVSFLGVFDTVSDDASDKHLKLMQRISTRICRLYNQIFWNVKTFVKKPVNEKDEFFASKLKSIIQRITKDDYNLQPEGISEGKNSELPIYLHKVHKANNNALENYILKEYGGKLHLFRAMDQTFYIRDPETYGWSDFVKGNIVLHDIPGSHSRIFAPPNDQIFAQSLQKCLDEINLN